MNILELTIQRKAEYGYPVVAEYTTMSGGLPTRREGTFQVAIDELNSHLASPRCYGQRLGQALFRDAILSAFDSLYQQPTPYFRLLLFIEAPDLQSLHWERLQAPQGNVWQFLTFDQRVLYSRYLPSVTSHDFPPIGRRNLRALILIASPDPTNSLGLSPFDETPIIHDLEETFAHNGIPYDLLSANCSNAVATPTLDNLVAYLTKTPYTLLHIVAHGRYSNRNQETTLFLHKDGSSNGNAVELITSQMLLDELSYVTHKPYFIFLSTCESATPSAETGVGGLGHRLVRDLGLPAVLAMTDTISVMTATQLAQNFYGYLFEEGEVDLALSKGLSGITRRPDSTVPAIFSRLAGRPLFSDQLDRDPTPEEIRTGLDKLAEYVEQRAPTLTTKYQTLASLIRPTLTTRYDSLSQTAQAERQTALAEINALCEEVLDISFNALALGTPPPDYNSDCPFMGLHKFGKKDAEYFFGRDTLVSTLIGKLQRVPFLAVLGPSGSGKSSVVLAGLIPALEAKEFIATAESLTPGAEPLQNLAKALRKTPDMVVVDQFEEVFTLAPEAERKQFFKELLDLANEQNKKVVVTMRADFWGDCASYPALKEVMLDNQELVGPMTSQELRSAMEKQAQKVGLRFEADLSHTILDDVEGEPGAMPLLQHGLRELWEYRHGRWLKAEEYRDNMGGSVRQSISRTANALYDSLKTDEERAIVQSIFLDLTRLDESRTEVGYRDTRQRVQIDKLAANFEATKTRELVHKLANERLIVTAVDETTSEFDKKPVYVEVAHEALIRHWPRLRAWIEEDREFLVWKQRLKNRYREWKESGNNADLLNGTLLQQGRDYLQQRADKLNPTETSFIKASIRYSSMRFRVLLAGGLFIIGLLIAFSGAIYFWWITDEARTVAETERKRSDGLQLAFAAQNQDSENHELALLLAIEASDKVENLETDTTLRYMLLHRGQTVARLTKHTEAVKHLVWNPDADKKQLLTSSAKEIIIWDTQAWQPLKIITPRRKINHVVWSPDGNYITLGVEGETEETAQIWRLQDQTARFLVGHNNAVNYVAWNQDGTWLATASQDKTVKVWEIQANQQPSLVSTLPHQARVDYAVWNKDSTQLMAISNAKTYVWQLTTLTPTIAISLANDGRLVKTALWNNQETRILTVDNNVSGVEEVNNLYVWDAKTGVKLATLTLSEPINQAYWSKDGERIVVAGNDEQARIWLVDEDRETNTMTGHEKVINTVIWNKDETEIMTGSEDRTIRIWDVRTGDEIAKLTGHGDTVNQAVWSPDEKWVVSISNDETVRVWNPYPGEELPTLVGHEAGLTHVAWNSDGDRIVTASEDRTARIWDVQTGEQLFVLAGHGRQVNQAVWSPDGNYVVTIANEDTVRFWNAHTGKLLKKLSAHGLHSFVNHVQWFQRHNELWLVTASDDKTARIWTFMPPNTVIPRQILGEERIENIVNQAVWNPTGNQIATIAYETNTHTLRIWDVDTGTQLVGMRGHSANVTHVAWDKTGKWLITASNDNTVVIWDAHQGQVKHTLAGHNQAVNHAIWHPDGNKVATASDDGSVIIWDISQGQPIHNLIGHTNGVNYLAWHHSGEYLVTASNDQTARIWDTNTGQTMAVLAGHENFVNQALWSPDGEIIVTASEDGTARLYYSRLKNLRNLACQRTVRNMSTDEWQQYINEPYQETCLDKPNPN